MSLDQGCYGGLDITPPFFFLIKKCSVDAQYTDPGAAFSLEVLGRATQECEQTQVAVRSLDGQSQIKLNVPD